VGKLLYLQANELFGQVGPYGMPITCDSGAQVSVVPEECVREEEFTGETQLLEDFHTGRVTGRVCQVTFTIAGRPFKKRAVTQPGELLRWTPCMAVPLNPREEMDFVLNQIGVKEAACREETRYLPPTMDGDVLMSGLIVCDGEVVTEKLVSKVTEDENSNNTEVIQSGSIKPEQEIDLPCGGEEQEDEAQVIRDLCNIDLSGKEQGSSSVVEAVLGDHDNVEEGIREDASVLDEEGGVSLGGSAEDDQLLCGMIGSSVPREALAKATAEDQSLQMVRRTELFSGIDSINLASHSNKSVSPLNIAGSV